MATKPKLLTWFHYINKGGVKSAIRADYIVMYNFTPEDDTEENYLLITMAGEMDSIELHGAEAKVAFLELESLTNL